MKIYTKAGDDGQTGLIAGGRVSKDHPRIEACGAVDELNAWLGVVRAGQLPAAVDRLLERVQHDLFALGAQLAAVDPTKFTGPSIDDEAVGALEQAIDEWEQKLPPLCNFILPGGTPPAAALHAARTTCRRAERRVVHLKTHSESPVPVLLIRYLNRLSDLLFVAARTVNAAYNVPDQIWRK
jgi:cob(I)alamin adenosyltransferase